MRNYFSKLGTQVPWRTSQSRGATLALPLRYLSALFLLLTFSIGQSWAALTAHTPGVYEKATDEGGYGATIVTVDERDYEVYGFSYNSSGAKPQILWAGTSANNASASQVLCSNLSATPQEIAGWISMSTAGKSSTYSMPSSTEFAASSVGSSGLYQMKMQGHSFTIKVKGYDQFSFLGNDNNGTQSKNKYMQVTINGSDVTKDLSSSTTVRRYDLNASIESTIVITGLGTSNEHIDAFSLRLPEAPTCSTEITTQPSGATLAIDDANPELSIEATNVASYAWKESSDGTSYNGASSLGSSASFTPSVNDAVQTKYYYCEVTSDCDGTTVVKSNIVTVNVVGAISYYTVTLNPAGGTIVDATGWTSKDGNYEKKVAEGTELTLPIFTKTGRTFKTWRKAGPADVASPVTVDGDLSLTAIWTATIEQVIYSWEGAEGGAIETGGTAAGNVDNLINQPSAGYYCLKIDGNNSYSANLVTITLAGEEKVKTGDKIKYWGFYVKDQTKSARPKMRDANSPNASIFDDPDNLPNLYSGGDPAERTFTVPASINTNAVQLTRSQTGSNTWISKLQIIREVQVEEGDLLTVTFDANGGSAIAPVVVASGQAVAKPADPTWAHHRFNEWQLAGSAYDFSSAVTTDITLVANWTQLYTISFAAGDGSGDAPAAIADKAKDETFEVPANTFTPPTGQVFDHWNDGATDYNPEDTYTVGTSNVILTAIWRTPSTMYAITKGAHENGDFTIDPASQEAGEVVTLEATPNDGYLFGAWEVVKTEDASATGITVDANGQFTMPGYAVTVNATFAADSRKKILYVTNNDEATTKANDKLYEALKDDYRVTIVGPTSDADQTNYDLVVLHESIGGGNYGATAVAAAKTGNTPVLNTKSYFYNDGRWGWGAPNAGQSVKGATLNSSYCNIADHPLFDGVTMTAGFFEITDDAAAKCMQPLGSFTSGKEGYTLATTPNNGEGNGCAIHELTPAQRGASAGKYLMISVSGDKLNALNANGQKLFQNAAAYLIGSTSWDPIAVPTAAVIEAAPTAAYSVGDNIALSALAAGVSATTTYTWYKGDSWAAAETAGAIQAAKTAAEGGDSYGITDCALGDAGIYWCVISNGTDCEAKASVEVTVVDASYNISFSSAHGTAPSATTGVSYTLPELTASGWAHQGWTASVNVFVDAEEVVAGTLIANGKMAVFGLDVTFTAVWAQEFQVTFNGNGHGTPIAAQTVVNGELATEPAAPFEIGYDFGGWFTDAECTAGNEFDFETPITAATPLFAKWTAFDGCAWISPATSGTALHAGDVIDLQTGSTGVLKVVSMKSDGSIAYNEKGLSLNGGGADVISVTLDNQIQAGTIITVSLEAAGTGTRGLKLQTATGTAVSDGTLGWSSATAEAVASFSYTAVAGDGLVGSKVFRLQRNNSVYLRLVKVANCASASYIVTYKDGETVLGTEDVFENAHPAAAGISTFKAGYEFQGWSETSGGAIVDLNDITITADKDLFAVFALKDCSGTGVKFSAVAKPNELTSDLQLSGTEEVNIETLGDYATVSGGVLYLNNNYTSNRVKITKGTSAIQLVSGAEGYIHVMLECPLKEYDIIRFENDERLIIANNLSKTGSVKIAKTEHQFEVPAAWEDGNEFFIWRDGTSLSISSIEVYRRPALTDASLANLTIAQGLTKTPELTLLPSADALVTSQAWAIVGTPDNLTGASIDPATGAITTGTLDNPSLDGTISVKVTLNGSIGATCTVTVVDAIVQQDVTKSTIWDWKNSGAAATIQLTNSSTPKKNEGFVMANQPVNNNANFESDKLYVECEYVVREPDKTPYFQGQTIKFKTTVAGVVRVKFSNTGSNPARELYINGVGTGVSSANATYISSGAIEVPVGEVSITAYYADPADGTNQQPIRIAEVEFYETIDSRTGYAAKELGTACYEYDAVILGAKAYEVAGVDAHGYMAFDLIESGKIDAAKPYLFEADGGKIFFCKQVGASATAATEEVAVKGMYGTFGGTTLNQGDNNYYYFSGRHIWRVNDFTVAIPIPAHRCYVDYDELKSSKASAPAPGRRRVVLGLNGKDAEQVATGIGNVQGDEVQSTKVLINGQLFILRGEKMYDATGRLVK